MGLSGLDRARAAPPGPAVRLVGLPGRGQARPAVAAASRPQRARRPERHQGRGLGDQERRRRPVDRRPGPTRATKPSGPGDDRARPRLAPTAAGRSCGERDHHQHQVGDRDRAARGHHRGLAAGHLDGVAEDEPQQPRAEPGTDRAPASARRDRRSRRAGSAPGVRSAACSPARLRWVTRTVSWGTDPRATHVRRPEQRQRGEHRGHLVRRLRRRARAAPGRR